MSLAANSEYSYLNFYGYRIDSKNSQATKKNTVDVPSSMDDIPPRSPKRLLCGSVQKFNSIEDIAANESPSMSDASSFDEQSYFSHSGGTDDSIFSKETPSSPELTHSKDPINLSEMEDIDLLLDEIQVNGAGDSNVIFSVDEIITVVAISSGKELGSERRITCTSV